VRKSPFRIGEVARRAGVTVDTVRYYEKRALLARVPRSAGGYRLFTEDTIERVRFIKQAQETGFSLDEIQVLLDGGGAAACRKTRDLLQARLEQVSDRIKRLSIFKRTLTRHLQACENELARGGTAAKCPVILEIGRAARKR
jgi:DNA-binding transcriptional MerR regulator